MLLFRSGLKFENYSQSQCWALSSYVGRETKDINAMRQKVGHLVTISGACIKQKITSRLQQQTDA